MPRSENTEDDLPSFVRLHCAGRDNVGGGGILERLARVGCIRTLLSTAVSAHDLWYGGGSGSGGLGAAYTACFDAASAFADTMDLRFASLRLKDIALCALVEREARRLRLLRRKKKWRRRSGGGVIPQEVNSGRGRRRPAIKVRLNKSFRSKREWARRRRASKGVGEDGDDRFKSCNVSEDGGSSSGGGSESSASCLVHPVDAAIVKELNERAEATDRSTPLGRVSFLFVRGVDLGFVLVLLKALFVLALFFMARSLTARGGGGGAWPDLSAFPACQARAAPMAYEDCSPIERFAQCCLM